MHPLSTAPHVAFPGLLGEDISKNYVGQAPAALLLRAACLVLINLCKLAKAKLMLGCRI
jgi:hypothetical protein